MLAAGAGLLLGVGMSAVTLAEGNRISLPRRVDAPITLRLGPGEVASAASDPANVLQVFVGSPHQCCEGRLPVAGAYGHDGSGLVFTPAFGFVSDVDYVARVAIGDGEQLVPFRIPTEHEAVDAIVTDVFPSADTLPENVLRFYLHFSVPMAPHVAFDHIALHDASGVPDDAAFMRFKQELWNPDRTRLTVLIDPGRIKRQVATNVGLGPALQAGQQFRLSVAEGWPSADGTGALPAFSKTFTVSDPIRERPDVGRWQVVAPCVGTLEPVEVRFDCSFDRHQLQDGIRILTDHRNGVAGTVQIDAHERGWRFIPTAPWAGDRIRIVVDPSLEDVAGNNFRELLDATVREETPDPVGTERAVSLRICGGTP